MTNPAKCPPAYTPAFQQSSVQARGAGARGLGFMLPQTSQICLERAASGQYLG